MLGSFSSTISNPSLKGELAAYVIFFLLGMGNLFPWNAFVTAARYYQDHFCGTPFENSFESYFSIIYTLAQPFGLFINIYYHKELSIKALVFYPLLIYAVVFYAVNVMVAIPSIPANTLFAVTMLANFLCGVVGSIMNGGMFALSGVLPSSYTAAIMSGQAMAGLVVAVVSMITAAASPAACNDDDADDSSCSNSDSIDYGAFSYFMVACVVLTICIWLYMILMRLPFIIYHLDKLTESVDKSHSLSTNVQTKPRIELNNNTLTSPMHTTPTTPPVENSFNQSQLGKVSRQLLAGNLEIEKVQLSFSMMSVTPVLVSSLFSATNSGMNESAEPNLGNHFDFNHIMCVGKKIMIPSYAVFMTFAGTLMVFPTIMVLIIPTESCSQSRLFGDLWIPTMFILLNAGDLVGRVIAQVYEENPYITPTNIHVISTLRLINPILFLFCNISDNHLASFIKIDGIVLVLVFVLGLSNGILANLAMMFGPTLVQISDAPLAGTIMMFWLNCGLLIGSALSFLWLFAVTGNASG